MRTGYVYEKSTKSNQLADFQNIRGFNTNLARG